MPVKQVVAGHYAQRGEQYFVFGLSNNLKLLLQVRYPVLLISLTDKIHRPFYNSCLTPAKNAVRDNHNTLRFINKPSTFMDKDEGFIDKTTTLNNKGNGIINKGTGFINKTSALNNKGAGLINKD